MKDRRHLKPNLRIAIVGALLLCVAGLSAPTLAGRYEPDPHQLDRFMWGIAGQESGWSYYARNPNSGAFGRYQIMPDNWRSWSRRYLGRGWNDESPLNQELVARSKFSALYGWLGDWSRVAYWWLSGSSDAGQATWSATGKRYVSNVLSLMSRAPKTAWTLPSDPAGGTGMPVNVGDWRQTLKPAKLRDMIGSGYARIGYTGIGDVFRVRKAEWNADHTVLWLRVQAADGTAGWVNSRKTLPAQDPKAA